MDRGIVRDIVQGYLKLGIGTFFYADVFCHSNKTNPAFQEALVTMASEGQVQLLSDWKWFAQTGGLMIQIKKKFNSAHFADLVAQYLDGIGPGLKAVKPWPDRVVNKLLSMQPMEDYDWTSLGP